MLGATRVMGWALAVAVTLGAVGGRALAEEPVGPPCLQETLRWCPLVPVGLVEACIEAHVDNGDIVSPTCRRRWMDINDDHAKLMDDCQSDLSNFCNQKQTYAGERVKCLTDNRDKLSAGCRKTFDKLSEK